MKQFLKIGCLAIVGIFVMFVVIGYFIGDDSNEKLKPEIKADNMEIIEKPMLTDSILNILVSGSFRADKDEFKKISFYYHNLTPKYINKDWVFPYIGKNESNVWMRFKMQYEDDDWLFINKVQFLIDGEPTDFASGSFKRDNNGGRIWEWGDIEVNEVMAIILRSIANSKEAKVRYTGNQYHNDRTITTREKKVMLETLAVYDSLNTYRLN
ncbi:MAG: hypothetical protein AAFO99_15825 [Bacteroidota bacterium]